MAFHPLATWKIKLLKHWRKYLEILPFYTCTINDNHIMHGSWDMEHKTEFFVILDCFLSLYPPYGPRKSKFWKNERNLSLWTCVPYRKIILCMVSEIWSVMDRIFCHFRIFFCPFTPLTTWKIKLLKKWKNTWSYYHFTHVYQKWQPYNVWFLRHGADRHNFLSFWTIFCPFTPLTTQKIKILKKGKKPWRYYHFTPVYY